VTSLAVIGTCLDFAAEDHRVTERNAALERMSAGFETLWSDPRRRSVIVLLQDRAQHIGESVDGCHRALTTMHLMTHKYRGSQQSSREVLPKFIDSTQGEPKNICKP
jgi:hypothetical protein